MKRFTNPLDNIRVASPCKSNWGEMYGNERKRFCAECKLNVYNLSDMTRFEAENLLMNSEGRLCVRFFRRTDGTVLTKDCPVGWKAVRMRVSKTAAAVFSIIAGFLGGIMAVKTAESAISAIPIDAVPALESIETRGQVVGAMVGEADDFTAVDGQVDLSEFRRLKAIANKSIRRHIGRVEVVEKMENKKVVAWIR